MADYAPVATVEEGVELQEDPSHCEDENDENPASASDAAKEADEVEEADYDYPTPKMRGDTMSAGVPLLPVPFGRHIGRMSVCWEKRLRDGTRKFFCVIGPCWVCSVCITFPLIIVISGATFVSALPNWTNPLTWCAWALLAAVCLGLFMTCTTDPGIMPRYAQAQGRGWRWNSAAQSFHPPGVTYDPEAQVLFKNVDHFCPWTGTVIADNNLFYFHWFVSTLPILCIVVIMVALLTTKSLADRERKWCWENGQRIRCPKPDPLHDYFHNMSNLTIPGLMANLTNATFNGV